MPGLHAAVVVAAMVSRWRDASSGSCAAVAVYLVDALTQV